MTLDYYTPPKSPLSTRAFRVATVLLAIVGVQTWLTIGRGYYGLPLQYKAMLAIILIAMLPPVHRPISAAIDRLRGPSPRQRLLIALSVSALAFTYFVTTAILQRRDFDPMFADDFSYLLQIRMLSHGRLWMPAHPLADFFESQLVLVEPAYASIYFPGAAMLFVPATWLGVPAWLWAVMISAAVIGMSYRIVAQAMDGAAGILVAIMLVSTRWLRTCSTMVASRMPLMLLALIAIWAWMRWREDRQKRWVIMIGAMAGWGAITRPIDALCFAVPIGVAMLVELIRSRAAARGILRVVAIGVLSAAPFLGVQLIANKGITGKWTQTPFNLYADRDYPQTSYGFHGFDPTIRPASKLPQKQQSYDKWVVPFLLEHRPENVLATWLNSRLPTTIDAALPHHWLTLLLPLGLLSLTGWPRRVIWLMIPMFVVGYAFYAFFLQPYAVMLAPSLAMGVLLGVETLRRAWARLAGYWTTSIYTIVLMLSVTQLPEMNHMVFDQILLNPFRAASDQIAALKKPSIVLFNFSAPHRYSNMAVYNIDVLSPDDAFAIRANDLGPRNAELFRYYAQVSPERDVYIFDQATDQLKPLGNVKQLAESSAPSRVE